MFECGRVDSTLFSFWNADEFDVKRGCIEAAVVTNRYTDTSLHEDDLADHFVSTYSLSIRVVTPM